METIASLISLFPLFVALALTKVSFSFGHPLVCSSDEFLALLQFSQSIPIGDYASYSCPSSYPKTTSWNRSRDCCTWDGVTCDRFTSNVIGLDLSCSQLEGTIHPNSTLFQLRHLQILDLSRNDFSRSHIPQGIGQLSGLMHLNLSYSGFEGRIPSEISHLSKLVSLDLSVGSLNFSQTGFSMLLQNITKLEVLSLVDVNIASKIPMNFSSLSLRYLDLASTRLHGDLPQSIFFLPNLESLRLSDNYLTISFPKFNWSSSHSITELDLSSNNISGGLPASFGSLKALQFVDFRFCNLVGRIPESISNLSRITVLGLSGNHLESKIPDAFSNLQMLIQLALEDNAFIGPFPSSLVNLTSLEVLNLGDNALSGLLPSTANGLHNLNELGLYNTSLNGSIPSWLFSLPSLTHLHLKNNHFSGPLPEFKTNSLQVLDLSQNQLCGPIPQSLRDLVNLTSLTLGDNKLSGEVGAELFSSMTKLLDLDLSHSGLSWSSDNDSINITIPNLTYVRLGSCRAKDFPKFLINSKELHILDLSENEIQGQFPKWFGDLSSSVMLNLSHNYLTSLNHLPWQNMEFVDLQSNSLAGPLPSSLCRASYLRFLDLSYNNLTSEIPSCLFTNSELRVLSLQANNFHGPIPNKFPKSSLLFHISLSKNQLEGPIPSSLINCTYLQFLNFGNNKIRDTFPSWLETLQELEVLVLKSNRFYGPIGGFRKKSPIPKLRIFDLSSNSFTGSLPSEVLKGFKAMRNVDAHNSSLEYLEVFRGSYGGSVGITLKNQGYELRKILLTFTTIDLSRNKFEGEIPKILGNLNSLRLLNLSHNNLTGHIPVEMKNMSTLEALDLSFNQLIGEIPEELTSLTFLAVLNLSHNHLVGPIPRQKQFNTFQNDSYVGNPGLCGFPLSNDCGHKSAPPVLDVEREDDDEPSLVSEITFQSVIIGYGCGLICGFIVMYLVYKYERPRWFIVFFASITHENPFKARRGGQRSRNLRRRRQVTFVMR